MSKLFFSVIIPLHNKEHYIKRAIQSIINQTYTDFELLIVDDASTDKSLQNAQEIKDERIRFFYRTEKGYGGYAARNLGIEKAKYDHICFLDADDEWLPNHLSEIANLIRQFPDIRLFSSGWQLKAGTITKTDAYSLHLKNKSPHKVNDFFLKASTGMSPVHTITICIHKDIFKTAGNFPAGKCKKGGDVECWMRCNLKSQLAHTGQITAIYYKDITDAVTKTVSDFEPPYVAQSAKQILKTLDKFEAEKIKKYANYYGKISILRAIVHGKNKKQMLNSFFKDVDKKYYLFFKILSIFPSFILLPLYKFYRKFMFKYSKTDLS